LTVESSEIRFEISGTLKISQFLKKLSKSFAVVKRKSQLLKQESEHRFSS
jgi:hypothetical protein